MMGGKIIYEGINTITSPQDKNYNAQSIPDKETARFLLNLWTVFISMSFI